MSRIQDILSKAEREGTARRTRALSDDFRPAPATLVPSAPVAPPAAATPAGGTESEPLPIAPVRLPTPASHVAPTAARTTEATLDRRLVAALAPHSLAAEQYRSLRTRINRAGNTRALRAILITSPAKGDGKSLTAANLALTMAQEFQQRVALIDADLRRPSLQRLFGTPSGPGLVDVLVGVADLDQALVEVPDHHVTLLTAGVPSSHPAELLGSASMRRVLDMLRTRFDRILIDMPPVAPLADVHVVAPMADAVLMIVRAGVTPKPAIEQALAGLDRSKVLGLVLNEAGDRSADYGYEGYGYIAG